MAASWSSVLQGIIKLPIERQHLATAVGVTTTTLTRWANGESTPQRNHAIRLVQSVHPEKMQELFEGLVQVYPDMQVEIGNDATEQIPPAFFAQVLNICTTTTDSLRFWRISEVVLKQALAQLDPNRQGMAVKLVQCMPPRDGKVRSLRERAGKGNPPWTTDLEHDVLFLGVESLSGYAVEVRHIVNDDDLRKSKPYPSVQDTFEVSAAAHPIRFEGRIAGCLLASSTQEAYFSQQRQALLAAFSDLIALALDRHEFYLHDDIDLRVMPPPERQRQVIGDFLRRVRSKFRDTSNASRSLSSAEREMLVWQELEAELLTMGRDTNDNL